MKYHVYVKLKNGSSYEDIYYDKIGHSVDYMVNYIQEDIDLIYPDNLGMRITKY